MADPVRLDEAKAFLRVTHDAEDALIATLLQGAREVVEAALGEGPLDETAPAAVRTAVLMRLAHAYDGRLAPDLDAWLGPFRRLRL